MQFYDVSPALARWLIARAAKRLQNGLKDRYHEEWLSHLQECNGKLGALFHGLGCLWASFAMRMPLSKLMVQTKAYILMLFMEWLVRLRIEVRARQINTAAQSGIDKAESERIFETIVEDMAKIVLFGMYRKQVFTFDPDNAALNAMMKPLLALLKWPSRKL